MRFYRNNNQVAGFGFMVAPGESFPVWEAGETWIPHDWKLGWHTNAGWELFYQDTGRTSWQVGRRLFEVPERGCYLIPPGVKHRLVGAAAGASHFYYVVFADPTIAGMVTDLPTGTPVFHRGQAHALELPFAGLIRSIALAGVMRETTTRAYAECLAATVVEIGKHGLVELPGFGHPAALHARDLIENNLSHPWRLDELARLSGVSKPHLIAVFREAFGEPPQQFWVKARLKEAARALQESTEPITVMAMRLGFSSSQHLATAFRKHYGESPRHYRLVAR